LAFLLALPVAAARGDGDPASDVLIGGRIFWPYSIKVPAESREALQSTVIEAWEKGFRIRVALINNEFDLGTAGLLSRHPTEYAKFLAQELANFNTDWLLIVMPNGYGIYHCEGVRRAEGYVDPCEKETPTREEMRVLRSLAAPEQARVDLAASGEVAVRELAALHGVELGPSWLRVGLAGVGVVLALGAGGFMVLRRARRVA
jgi:hypothetical protein